MSWQAYKLTYKAKSPIHIGWLTLGYINLTRYYIPGKNMWASFTSNLARVNQPTDNLIKHYEDYGRIVRENIIASYFYPCREDGAVLRPAFTDRGLNFGDLSKAEFERRYIKSYGQTAIVPHSNTAEDESLHESEFISHRTAEGETLFTGYLFVNSDGLSDERLEWHRIKDHFKELFVGGDRKYGWGHLVQEGKIETTGKFFGFNIVNGCEIKVPKGSHIPAHLSVKCNLKLKGDIEPLVGREWGDKGAGQKIESAGVFWTPGSFLQNGGDLEIGSYGILKTI